MRFRNTFAPLVSVLMLAAAAHAQTPPVQPVPAASVPAPAASVPPAVPPAVPAAPITPANPAAPLTPANPAAPAAGQLVCPVTGEVVQPGQCPLAGGANGLGAAGNLAANGANGAAACPVFGANCPLLRNGGQAATAFPQGPLNLTGGTLNPLAPQTGTGLSAATNPANPLAGGTNPAFNNLLGLRTF